WRNNLRRHQFRGVWPFSDTTESAADLAAADIDKQFWQNINRVRVAGGGTTNYVMAKDDIGNWYVKSYETDVDDIINSTIGLAKFALGARLGTDFLSTPNGQTPKDRSGLERAFDSYRQRYHEATRADYSLTQTLLQNDGEAAALTRVEAAALREVPDEVPEATKTKHSKIVVTAHERTVQALTSVWETEEADTPLLTEATAKNQSAAAVHQDIARRADRVIDGLRALHRFDAAATAAIQEQTPTLTENARGTYDQAKTSHAEKQAELDAVNAKLNRLAEDRAEIVAEAPAADAAEDIKKNHTQRLEAHDAKVDTLREQRRMLEGGIPPLRAREDEKRAALDAELAGLAAAKQAISREIGALILTVYEKREKAVAAFQNGVAALGEAAAATAPASPATSPAATVGAGS
ncbi:MAG: hypothetical protein ACPGVX_10820, partial [Thalassobaculaceae bacterium]